MFFKILTLSKVHTLMVFVFRMQRSDWHMAIVSNLDTMACFTNYMCNSHHRYVISVFQMYYVNVFNSIVLKCYAKT